MHFFTLKYLCMKILMENKMWILSGNQAWGLKIET